MGFRLRKSINLGGGFKINLSKSGIGYSFGIPGLRYTQMANGRQRTTYSIPGTCLSYVEENGKNKKSQTHDNNQKDIETTPTIEVISSIKLENNSNGTDFLAAINKFKKKDLNIKTVILLFSILFTLVSQNVAFLFLGIITLFCYLAYRNKSLLLKAKYDFDDESRDNFERLTNFLNELASCNKIWLIDSQVNNMDVKRNAGSNVSVKRTAISISKKLPYYLKSNIDCYCIQIAKISMYFLPDHILIDSDKTTTVADFNNFIFEFGNTIFIEEETVSKDSKIIDYTWQYVNKNGTPDKRFKDNHKYPKCNYGSIIMKNNSGFNISLLLSSQIKTKQAELYYNEFKKYSKKLYKYCINCNTKISAEANFCKYCGTKQY